MRFLTALLLCTLATASSPVYAADPNQIFSTILGELGRQIERKQQKKQLRRLRPLWEACANRDVDACDRAARFPNLTDEARSAIARMRHNAEIWPDYERNFYACQKWDRAACQAALAYPYLDDTDRSNLEAWKRVADQRHDALDAFRQNQRECHGGSLTACDAAIRERHLDESVIPDLERQRIWLQAEQRERQAREQQRRNDVDRFHRHQRNCYNGSIPACDAVISERHLDESVVPDIERQRTRLKAAERQRRALEQQRQAAVREYDQLRTSCTQGDRAACKRAAAHPQVGSSDLAFLEKRDRELAPITERVTNLFAQADLGGSKDAGSSGAVGLALLSVITLLGGVAGAVFVIRSRGSVPPARSEPPSLVAETPAPSGDQKTPLMFPLTGHMPTDIRHAIILANQ